MVYTSIYVYTLLIHTVDAMLTQTGQISVPIQTLLTQIGNDKIHVVGICHMSLNKQDQSLCLNQCF